MSNQNTTKPDGEPQSKLSVTPHSKRPKPQQLPPFKLLLHNDDINTMDEVVRSIITLTPLNSADAIRRMFEAHRSGTALLLTTHRERGELYVDQFSSVGITTSLESDH